MAEEDAQVGALNSAGGGVEKHKKHISQPVAMSRKCESNHILNYNTNLLLSKEGQASDSEEGFLSTSPDSANGECSNVNSKKPLIKCIDDMNLGKTVDINATIMTTTTTTNTVTPTITITTNGTDITPPPPIFLCSNPKKCVSLKNILNSFKAPLSEEQAWALIYQFMSLYRNVAAAATAAGERHIFSELEMPDTIENLNMHRDGSVHCSWSESERKEKEEKLQQQQQQNQEQQEQMHTSDEHERGEDSSAMLLSSQKKILRQIAVIIYTAMDYNLQADEQCQMSSELEELITYMTADENDDDCIDEGIDEGCRRWDDENEDDNKCCETKEFEFVLEACKNHIKPTVPEEHYKAVCRALVTETIELRVFLQQVLNDGAANLHFKADSQTSKQELAKLGFNDWARFWVQVIDELRRGVRLKKNSYERAPIEYELTPYEILMEDIRSKKYQLRKVMVNGDIPPRVKKDAHAMILEFIRSRPPLKKASERQLPPPICRTLSPREQLMDSIRKGQTLKHIQPPATPRLKDRLLPPSNNIMTSNPTLSTTPKTVSSAMTTVSNNALDTLKLEQSMESQSTPRSKQRLIKVDFSLLQDDDTFFNDSSLASTSACSNIGVCSQPKMPPYPIGGYMMSNVSGVSGNSNNQSTTNKAYKAQNSSVSTAPQVPSALTTRVLRRTSI